MCYQHYFELFVVILRCLIYFTYSLTAMENLEESYELLSTMSPKLNVNSNKNRKKLGKLALKKQIRRSSIYDKLPLIRRDAITISASDTTESISTSSLKSINDIEVINEIVQQTHFQEEIPLRMSKSNEIEKWLSQMNLERNSNCVEQTKSCNMSVFSEISVIYGDGNDKAKSDDADINVAANSTFMNDKNCFRFDELFQTRSKQQILNVIDEYREDTIQTNEKEDNLNVHDRIPNNDDLIIINDSYDEIPCFVTPVKTEIEINNHENLLDEIYGNSWRINRDRVLTQSEPKQKGKTKVSKVEEIAKTERKPKKSITYKNPYLETEINKSAKLLRHLHITRIQNMIESPWLNKFKGLCDSESSTENLNDKQPTNFRTKLNFQDSDSETDEIKLNTEKIEDIFGGVGKENLKNLCNIDNNAKTNEKLRKDTNLDKVLGKQLGKKSEYKMKQNSYTKTISKNIDDRFGNGITNKKSNIDPATENEKKRVNGNKKQNKIKNIKVKIRSHDSSSNSKETKDIKVREDESINDKIKKLGINFKTVQESTKDVKTDLDKLKSKSIEISDNSESELDKNKKLPHIKLIQNGLLSQDKKIIKEEKDGKFDDKNNGVTRRKKLVKYFDSSPNDSENSSDDDLQLPFEILKNRHYVNQNTENVDKTYSFLASLSDGVPIGKCDPSAKIFRNTFKTNKDKLAQKLFELYNEKIFDNNIPKDVALEWSDRLLCTAGKCYCKKISRSSGQVERSCRIVMATKVVDSAQRLRDTLLHEMCHAATWIVNEICDGHGRFWKAWAEKAMKTFPELPMIKRCHNYEISKKYTYKCTKCHYSIGRHSKSLNLDKMRCGHCLGKFEIFYNKKTKDGVKTMPVTPKKEVSGFALFVKENYSSVKKSDLKHAEVMKILSKKFSDLKTQ